MKTFENNFVLKVAATPIGNLFETSERLLQAFHEVDIILCEDTRVTKHLLDLLQVDYHAKLVKFEKYNENQLAEEVINWIKIQKEKILLVSDAGYPLISDPGYSLVKLCEENEVAVEVINGPSSIIHALVASGFPTNNFMFLGFLGKTSNERINYLSTYKNLKTTFIILESVHRLKSTLADLYDVLGNQAVCIARELTKRHEEIIHSDLCNLINCEINLKGEFVLVVRNEPTKLVVSLEDATSEIKDLLFNQKWRTKDISNYISQKYKLDAKQVYHQVLKFKSDEEN